MATAESLNALRYLLNQLRHREAISRVVRRGIPREPIIRRGRLASLSTTEQSRKEVQQGACGTHSFAHSCRPATQMPSHVPFLPWPLQTPLPLALLKRPEP
jgi:hypothetical protein